MGEGTAGGTWLLGSVVVGPIALLCIRRTLSAGHDLAWLQAGAAPGEEQDLREPLTLLPGVMSLQTDREQLGKLEAQRGPNFWILGQA